MNAEAIKTVVVKSGTRCVVRELADVWGVSQATVVKKLKGRNVFRADEIEKFRTKYGLTDSQVVDLFIKGEAEK